MLSYDRVEDLGIECGSCLKVGFFLPLFSSLSFFQPPHMRLTLSHAPGDRTLATCRYCDWKSEHPKTFGMRAHVKACENVPEEKKLEFKQLEQAKREAKNLQKEASTRQRTVSKETAEAVKAGIEKKKKVAKEKAELESAKKAKSLEASPPAAGPSSPPKKRLKMDQETMNPGGRGIENDFDLYSTSTR